MTRDIWIDGARVRLAPAQLLGQGGEAEVYDLGDGRVLKWWKPPAHPDYDGLPDAQAAAAHRLAEQPAKLRALPGNLPAAVVTPCGLALGKDKRVVGYLMPKVTGAPLHGYGEPRWRREHPVAGADVVAVLLALHDAIAGLHRAGVVIGDCNDLNVLVDGRRVHLIDVDSYQLPGYPCAMYSERFVDPRLCDTAGAFVRPHDTDGDWFAYAVMAMRSLVWVGPWGGVHQPADPATRCPPPARAQRRVSVLGADIVYPRAARPLATLPEDVLEGLRAVFERDRRGVFPRVLLERLHLRACTACGEEHARARCPACATAARIPPAIVHGRLRWQVVPAPALSTYAVAHAIPPKDVLASPLAHVLASPLAGGLAPALAASLASRAGGLVPPRAGVWLEGGVLWRHARSPLGPAGSHGERERIGDVLAAQTRAWVGERLGVGYYRAGGYAVGFVFRPDRGVLDDRVALPRIRGQVIDAHATIGAPTDGGDDRAWLWLVTAEHGRIATTCVVIGADASVLATETLAETAWLAGIAGACAAGPHLFVPTDAGIARVEVQQGTLVQTRLFAETAPLVGSGDRLVLASGALHAIRTHDCVRLELA